MATMFITVIPAAIRDRIPPGAAASDPGRLCRLGPRTAVDQALHRLVASRSLRRIARGFYDIPQDNRLTGKPTILTRAMQDRRAGPEGKGPGGGRWPHRRQRPRDSPTPFPARIGRPYRWDACGPSPLATLTLEFQAAAPSRLYWAGRPAMRYVQALHWLRDKCSRPMTEASTSALFPSSKTPDHGQAIQDDGVSGPSRLAGVDADDRARPAPEGEPLERRR